jgi:hypothetical protein
MDTTENVALSSSEHVDLQHGLIKNKKKKCRGNRKLQRLRRKCRAQEMDNQSIEMLLQIKNTNTSVHQTKQEAAAAADDDDDDNQEMKHPLMTKNINNDANIMTSFDDKVR